MYYSKTLRVNVIQVYHKDKLYANQQITTTQFLKIKLWGTKIILQAWSKLYIAGLEQTLYRLEQDTWIKSLHLICDWWLYAYCKLVLKKLQTRLSKFLQLHSLAHHHNTRRNKSDRLFITTFTLLALLTRGEKVEKKKSKIKTKFNLLNQCFANKKFRESASYGKHNSINILK